MDNEVLFRDEVDIQPPAALYTVETKKAKNIYKELPPANFIPCQEDIWQPLPDTADADGEQEIKVKTRNQLMLEALRKHILAILDHKFTMLLVAIMTFWALFVEDFIIAINMDKSVDVGIAYVTLVFFALFCFEQFFRSIVEYSTYCFTFFWWMELLANVSMIFGLGALTVVTDECFDSVDIGTIFSSAFAQGARLARVMRLLRVIRVIRVFATCQKQRNPQSRLQKNQQSAIGKRVNEVLVRSMIIIVIALQTIFPFLTFDEDDTARALVFGMVALGANASTFPDMLSDYKFQGENYADADLICRAANPPSVCNPETDDYLQLRYYRLLKTVVSGHSIVYGTSEAEDFTSPSQEANNCLGDLSYTFLDCPPHIKEVRCQFLEMVPWDARPGDANAAFWDVTRLAQRTAWLNIALTWLLIVVIITMYVLLSLDVTQMVVQPIESMVGLVRRLAENPTLQLEGQSKSKYETEAVRIALAKIVGLMQLGFGGAGHEIISYNLANSERTGLDLMLRGKKKECAYGFCDIRQFTDTVECLQDQVMLFTNSVGEIVHQSCHDNRGEPNKNIGDAFLIVWRPRTLGDHTKIVDGALTAFRRCVREILPPRHCSS